MSIHSPVHRKPSKVVIRHVIEAARAAGIDVAGVEVSPDGTIRVIEARANKPASLFEQLEDRL